MDGWEGGTWAESLPSASREFYHFAAILYGCCCLKGHLLRAGYLSGSLTLFPALDTTITVIPDYSLDLPNLDRLNSVQ